MKRLMIIAGGEWQVPIIQRAKDMGLYVINTNLYPDSLGFEYADIGLVANVLDKEVNLEYAKQYAIDAVITDQSDIAVTTVAYVAEQLGLQGVGSKTSALFTNKYLMRKFCTENDFPTPGYRLCSSLTNAREFIDKNDLPVVVKPPANQSSRGISKIVCWEELEGAYQSALQYSHDGTVLLEDFVGGIELTVDGIQLNAGDHYCLATSCKRHYEHNEMIANQLLFTQHHTTIDYDELHCKHNRLIKRMGLPFGLTHAEYKYYEGEFYLIEVAARGGGTRLSSNIVPIMSGVDSNELLIRMAMGEQVSVISPIHSDRVSVLDFFEFEPGRIKMIKGVDEVQSLKGVVAVGVNVKVGDVIHPAADDRSRHGYIIIEAKTEAELALLLSKTRETIRVYYE